MDDPIYRRLFAFPRMVEDLLRAVASGGWIDAVDFRTLRKLPADHVGDHGQQRRGDAVWRVRFRDRWLYLLILLEFQSRIDRRMALRILEYTALLYRELDRQGELGTPGRWPAVLPIILYNGDAPWTAALEVHELIGPVPPVLAPCQPAQRSLVLDEATRGGGRFATEEPDAGGGRVRAEPEPGGSGNCRGPAARLAARAGGHGTGPRVCGLVAAAGGPHAARRRRRAAADRNSGGDEDDPA